MKYLCLAYYNPETFRAMAPADFQALVSQCPAKDAELKATGKLVVSASLEGPQAAFALRPRGGKTQVTDGPYAEAKELVGGFFRRMKSRQGLASIFVAHRQEKNETSTGTETWQ